jgi:hypothetical protein
VAAEGDGDGVDTTRVEREQAATRRVDALKRKCLRFGGLLTVISRSTLATIPLRLATG